MNFKPVHLSKGITLAADLKSKTSASWFGLLLRVWVIFRLPLLLLALYLFSPDEFIWLATISAIHLIGTAPERVAFFILIALTLSGSLILSQKIAAKPLRYLTPLGIAFILFLDLFQFIPGPDPLLISLGLTGVWALNTISETWLVNFITRNPGRRLTNIIFAVLVGVSELLLLKPFLLWLPGWRQTGNKTSEVSKTFEVSWGWLSGLILVPGLAAFLLDPYSLSDFHRTLFPDPAVRLFARGDINWLEFDRERHTLFASGHGLNYLQAYDIRTLDQPPQDSLAETGYAQSFAYNPAAGELYVYNELTQNLLLLDATTLALKKVIPTPRISPGDSWMVWDKFSDNIIIASEADEQVGSPIIVIDRITGEVIDTVDIAPGNIVLHPTKPLLYMSFFRRDNKLFVYDTLSGKIVKSVVADSQLNRMVLANVGGRLELFIASPMDSAVMRFDAETLEYKGMIKTLFAARAIAIDPVRNLLLCGSLVNNRLEVIDLATQQHLAEYYVSPWLRTILLDVEAGVAYVSSHQGLFTVQYAD